MLWNCTTIYLHRRIPYHRGLNYGSLTAWHPVLSFIVQRGRDYELKLIGGSAFDQGGCVWLSCPLITKISIFSYEIYWNEITRGSYDIYTLNNGMLKSQKNLTPLGDQRVEGGGGCDGATIYVQEDVKGGGGGVVTELLYYLCTEGCTALQYLFQIYIMFSDCWLCLPFHAWVNTNILYGKEMPTANWGEPFCTCNEDLAWWYTGENIALV